MADPSSSDDLAPFREFARMLYDEHGFLSWLDVSLEELDHGRAVLSMPYDERLTNPAMVTSGERTLHGGVIATLVDTAGGTALRTTLDDPTTEFLATTDLDVRFLQAAQGDLTCTAEVVRAGSVVGVFDAIVESDDDAREVAIGRGTYRLFRAEE